MNFNTKLLHDNVALNKNEGSTLTPIFQTSAFSYETAEDLENIFNNKAGGYAYTRIGNPTVASFEKKVAGIEHAIGGVACSSGSAAVGIALLNILKSGDEVIASSGIYGGTLDLFKDLESFGITVKYVSDNTPSEIEKLITNKTRAVFVEVIGNPRLDVTDIGAVSKTVHKYKIPFIVDSTTATSFLVKPIDLGADIVVHSSSKYINGTGNAISGIILDSGNFKWDYDKFETLSKYKKFGKFAYLSKLKFGLWRNLGCCLSPMNAFLNNIGIETLGIRMERACQNAYELAKFLSCQYNITVNYPALDGNPYKAIVDKQFSGWGGAILTLRAGSKESAYKLLNALKYPLIASNIGDVKTLVIHPYSTLFAHSNEEQKNSAGVYEDLIRVSVGIEDIDDLKEDFKQAIEKSRI